MLAQQIRLGDSDAPAPWLRELGLRFDPFEYLEASADPRLGDYVVGQEAFAVAWDDAPALVFAPAGGGKTAMRIYATRACWVGLGGAHPFPIPYILANHTPDRPPSPEDHLRELTRAGARALLIGLLFRPERFFQLESADRHAVTALLWDALPSPLPRYLAIARGRNGLVEVSRHVEPGYNLAHPPDRPALLALCDALAESLPAVAATSPPAEQFAQLTALLRGPLGFRSVYIMVDALDAFPETLRSPTVAVAWLEWMLTQAMPWATQQIFLKGFLPTETELAFATHTSAISTAIRHARLNWTAPMLAELIRRRVYVASAGEFGSLDAVCGPDVRDIETQLIRALPAAARLPREALVLVGRVLYEYARRLGHVVGRLGAADLDAAIRWYRTQPIRPTIKLDG
jgi:hypothetical protein